MESMFVGARSRRRAASRRYHDHQLDAVETYRDASFSKQPRPSSLRYDDLKLLVVPRVTRHTSKES